jgi:hypothetical protein
MAERNAVAGSSRHPLEIDSSLRPASPAGPLSAAISIGTSWGEGDTPASSNRNSISTDGEIEPPLPVSSQSSCGALPIADVVSFHPRLHRPLRALTLSGRAQHRVRQLRR